MAAVNHMDSNLTSHYSNAVPPHSISPRPRNPSPPPNPDSPHHTGLSRPTKSKTRHEMPAKKSWIFTLPLLLILPWGNKIKKKKGRSTREHPKE